MVLRSKKPLYLTTLRFLHFPGPGGSRCTLTPLHGCMLQCHVGPWHICLLQTLCDLLVHVPQGVELVQQQDMCGCVNNHPPNLKFNLAMTCDAPLADVSVSAVQVKATLRAAMAKLRDCLAPPGAPQVSVGCIVTCQLSECQWLGLMLLPPSFGTAAVEPI
jgi:hypothetical protein